MTLPSTRPRVVIAGGGIAAIELALALHDLAGDRVAMTMITPESHFALRPLRTAEPFAADHGRRHALGDFARRVDATLIADTVTSVDATRHAVRLASGGSVPYDTLVLAVGARHQTAFTRALTFTGDTSTLPFNGLLADLEEGWAKSVAFVVPAGTTWSLPLYELALMTARDVRGMGMDDVELQIVSPEHTPLAAFGSPASDAVAALLAQAGIAFYGDAEARAGERGRLELASTGAPLEVDRVVALPTIEGPQIAGVPTDDLGFIAIDDRGRVPGLDDVYAAGDGTTFPVKQGGIACQLADAIAQQLAAAAGADVEPEPFRPVLRGRLLVGHGAQYLERPLHDGAGAAPTPELQLWSASRKVDGRYLSPWLEELDGGSGGGDATPDATAADGGSIDIDIELPNAYEIRRDALRLDPYGPLPTRRR